MVNGASDEVAMMRCQTPFSFYQLIPEYIYGIIYSAYEYIQFIGCAKIKYNLCFIFSVNHVLFGGRISTNSLN